MYKRIHRLFLAFNPVNLFTQTQCYRLFTEWNEKPECSLTIFVRSIFSIYRHKLNVLFLVSAWAMFSNICFVTLEPKVSLKKTFLYNKGAVITYRMEEKTSRYFEP